MNNSKNQHNLWDKPWGYVESFIIGFGLIMVGFVIEFFTVSTTKTISFPSNIYLLVIYCLFLFIAQKWFSQIQLIRWISKVPAAITSIVLVTLMVIIMGVIPQQQNSTSLIVNKLGLNNITSNWAFLFILFLFLTNLGLISIKRILQFNRHNIGFILNHLGLFIALFAGILGSGDVQRLTIDLEEKKPNWIALNNGFKQELDFAFYLNDFVLEEYAPKLALIDNESGKLYEHNGKKDLFLIEKDNEYQLKNYRIKVEEFFTSSGKIGDNYAFVNEFGAPPSAKVTVVNKKENLELTNWLSCGSITVSPQSIKLNEKLSLIMTVPEPKKFSSDVSILNKDGSKINTIIEVNKPFKHKGWSIYQYSYDETFGKWSRATVLELVKDPWLPYIYLGIFMMIFGAFYMFWLGNSNFKLEK